MEKRTIYITEYDVDRLKGLISEAKRLDQRRNPYLDSLEAELARGQLVGPAEEMPPDVITMNSKVCLVDLDPGSYGHGDVGIPCRRVFTWQVPDGVRRLKVKQILYQPEASGLALQRAVTHCYSANDKCSDASQTTRTGGLRHTTLATRR